MAHNRCNVLAVIDNNTSMQRVNSS